MNKRAQKSGYVLAENIAMSIVILVIWFVPGLKEIIYSLPNRFVVIYVIAILLYSVLYTCYQFYKSVQEEKE